jgi:hypothetical protein
MIDQRILIIAPTDAVWAYLIAPATMQKWNRCARQMFILSTHAVGVGARRRCIDDDNRTTVEEITAWVENIGYEYKIIDGPYRRLKGRLRLQAVPEGTIVNWTVDYQLKGLLSNARNFLIFRRHYTRLLADSLRDLRRLVESSGARIDPEKQARFAMQADPGVVARAARAATMAEVAISTEDGSKVPVRAERIVLPPDERPKEVALASELEIVIDESHDPAEFDVLSDANIASAAKTNPLILHAFTPPKPEPIATPNIAAPTVSAEVRIPEPVAQVDDTPSTGIRIIEPPIAQEDTRPRKVVQTAGHLSEVADVPATNAPLPEEPNLLEDTPEAYKAMTVPISLVAPPPAPKPIQPVTQTIEIVTPDTPIPTPADAVASDVGPSIIPPSSSVPPDTLPERVPTPPAINLDQLRARAQAAGLDIHTALNFDPEAGELLPSTSDEPLPDPTDRQDTGEISIWDIFGVKSPTQQGLAALDEVVAQVRSTADMSAVQAPTLPAEPPITEEDTARRTQTVRVLTSSLYRKTTLSRRATIPVRQARMRTRSKVTPNARITKPFK